MVNWWVFWKRFGALPYPGGNDLLDQPAYVVDIILEYEKTLILIEQEIQASKAHAEEKNKESQLRRNRGG